jgi:hypothetical protein
MPVTAAERLLRNPFDPAQALAKSAEFLRELRTQFGNLGLAAAAYNAGPGRVRDWLAGKRTLLSETQAYVRIVTGRRAEGWRSQDTMATLYVTAPADMPCDKIAQSLRRRARKCRTNLPSLGASSSSAIAPKSRRSPPTARCKKSTRPSLAMSNRPSAPR